MFFAEPFFFYYAKKLSIPKARMGHMVKYPASVILIFIENIFFRYCYQSENMDVESTNLSINLKEENWTGRFEQRTLVP